MKDARRQIIEKGVQALLDEHKVPYRVHAAVLKRVGEIIQEHKADNAVARAERAIHEEMMASHKEMMKDHERQMQEWSDVVGHVLSLKPKKGDPGNPGKPGAAGKNADPVAIDVLARRVMSLIPTPEMPSMEFPTLDEEALFIKFTKRLKKDKSMTISDLKDGQGFLFNGRKYRFEELMRGAGGSASGGTNVSTEQLTPTAVGDDVTLDLTQLSNTFTDILFVTRNGQVLMPNGSSGFPGSSWSISGSTITVYNATDGDIYLVQYTYA